MYSVVVLTAIPKPGQRWRTKPASCPKRPVAPRSVQRRVTEDSSHSGKMLTDRTSAKTAIGLRRSNGQQTAAFQPFNLEWSPTAAFPSVECVLRARSGPWRFGKADLQRLSWANLCCVAFLATTQA